MRVSTSSTSDVYYLLTDQLGSTSLSLDASGNKVGELRYKPWGETRYTWGSTPTDRQYTGQINESYINLYWMNSRYYDPSLGRFVQPDLIIPDPSKMKSSDEILAYDRYIYVGNNPIKNIDPSGHCWGIASFIRGLPSYNTTCNNLDMAITILGSSKTSAGEKAGAGAYVAAEAVAHTALAVGAAGLACSQVAPCAEAATAILGIGQSVWNMDPFDRGVAIENMLGRSSNLSQNFPVIDRFSNGVATSIKSLDLMAQAYQNITNLTRTVQGYIDTIANWTGTSPSGWGGVVITNQMIQQREVLLAIPPNAPQAQLAALQQLVTYAQSVGVTLTITVVK